MPKTMYSGMRWGNALIFTQPGYQRQLTYAHPDGSYSPYGPSKHSNSSFDKGSIWLTAFSLKSIAQAKPYIFIDEMQLRKSVAFIIRHQDSQGCFPEVNPLVKGILRLGTRLADIRLADQFVLCQDTLWHERILGICFSDLAQIGQIHGSNH